MLSAVVISPSARSFAPASNAAERSAALWMSRTTSFNPREPAALSRAFTWGTAIGSARYESTRTREILGTASFSSSSRLAPRGEAMNVIPVTFPPGRARLATSPVPTGSPSGIMTIGTVRVAFFAAWAAGVVVTTMMSAFSRKQSAASEGNRSPWPAAER